MSKKSVIKHSAAVQIANKINLLQRQGWNVLLANAYDNLLTQRVHRVKVKEFKEVMCLQTKNDPYIKNFLKGLVGHVVEWNILDKDGKEDWTATGLLSKVNMKDGILTYSYDEGLAIKLHNPDMYARISLSMQNKFKSKHSLALYELCIDYFIIKKKYGTTPFITIEQFRELMGIPKNKYKDFKILNKWVLKDPINEINTKSDIFVEVEYKKEVRKVVAFKLHIKPNPKNKNLLLSEKILKPSPIKKQNSNQIDIYEAIENVKLENENNEKVNDIIRDRLKKIGYQGITLLRKTIPDDVLVQALDDVEFEIKRKEKLNQDFDNPAGWFYNRLVSYQDHGKYIYSHYFQEYLDKEKKKKDGEQKRKTELKKEQEKEQILKLETEFSRHREQKIKSSLEEFSEKELEKLNNSFETYYLNKYKDNKFMLDRFKAKGIDGNQRDYYNFLADYLLAKKDNDFITWAKFKKNINIIFDENEGKGVHKIVS